MGAVVSIAGDSFADYTKGLGRNTAIAASAYYTASYADFITDFYRYLQKWRSETMFESNTITQHPSYRSIVAMGVRALPLVVGELRIAPDLPPGFRTSD